MVFPAWPLVCIQLKRSRHSTCPCAVTITTQVCTDCRQILSFFSEQNLILWRGNKYSLYWGALLPVHFPFMVTSGSSQLNYSGWIIKLILTYSVLTLLGFLILLLFFFLSPWVKISILSAVLGRSEDFLKLFIEKKKKNKLTLKWRADMGK